MQREIKFRAYDEEIGEMFYSDKRDAEHFFEFKDGQLRGFAIRPPKNKMGDGPFDPPEPYCDDYPVEQFTGKKNFENDETCDGDKVEYFNQRQQILRRGIVVWDNENARFKIEGDGFYDMMGALFDWYQLKVVGSIHGNEILEVKAYNLKVKNLQR